MIIPPTRLPKVAPTQLIGFDYLSKYNFCWLFFYSSKISWKFEKIDWILRFFHYKNKTCFSFIPIQYLNFTIFIRPSGLTLVFKHFRIFKKTHLDNTLTCFWCQYLHFKLDWNLASRWKFFKMWNFGSWDLFYTNW